MSEGYGRIGHVYTNINHNNYYSRNGIGITTVCAANPCCAGAIVVLGVVMSCAKCYTCETHTHFTIIFQELQFARAGCAASHKEEAWEVHKNIVSLKTISYSLYHPRGGQVVFTPVRCLH